MLTISQAIAAVLRERVRDVADGTANQDLELLEGAASGLRECVAGEREVVFGGVGARVAPAEDARRRLAGLIQVAEQGES